MGSTDACAILPCPFCGHTRAPVAAHIIEFGDDADADYPNYRVCCRMSVGGCGCDGGVYRTIAAAVAAWNRRAPTPQGSAPAPGWVGAAITAVEQARDALANVESSQSVWAMQDAISEATAAVEQARQAGKAPIFGVVPNGARDRQNSPRPVYYATPREASMKTPTTITFPVRAEWLEADSVFALKDARGFVLAYTRGGVVSEEAEYMAHATSFHRPLLEGLEKAVAWLDKWIAMGCECEDGHYCGLSDLYRDRDEMLRVLARATTEESSVDRRVS